MGVFDRRRPLAERKQAARRRGLRALLPRRRPRRWLATVLATFALATLGPVACLRFVDPPTSAFMLRDGVLRLAAGKGWVANRWVDLRDISPAMPLAVVAAEDQRFPLHDGFDFEAIQKAARTNKDGRRLRGASTISQQVAKNLFLWPQRSWLRKGLEAYFTVAIETLWPKRRILEVYLNVAQFGDGVYGVEAAARRHFGVSARRLSAQEAALLAAVLPSPRRMSASRPGPYTTERARWIQGQMRQLGAGYLAKL